MPDLDHVQILFADSANFGFISETANSRAKRSWICDWHVPKEKMGMPPKPLGHVLCNGLGAEISELSELCPLAGARLEGVS